MVDRMPRPLSNSGAFWLTLLIVGAIFTVLFGIGEATTHGLTFTATVALIFVWIANLPFWVWISASILLGAHWIAKTIKTRP